MHPDQTQEIIALDRKVMARMAATWSDRVAVRKDRLDLSQYYDPGVPDFPVEIIPFSEDPEFRTVFDGQSGQARLRFLAATWIAYNERVIFIEDDVVQPFCTLLRKKLLPGVNDEVIQQVIVQSQVDEQFHTLMCLEVCSSARERHRLSDYVLPPPLLGRRIREQLVTTDDAFEHALILMSYATISETTIHDYLRKLSTITSIQPLNRVHTEMHRRTKRRMARSFSRSRARCIEISMPNANGPSCRSSARRSTTPSKLTCRSGPRRCLISRRATGVPSSSASAAI
jgi:hypothetical protein